MPLFGESFTNIKAVTKAVKRYTPEQTFTVEYRYKPVKAAKNREGVIHEAQWQKSNCLVLSS